MDWKMWEWSPTVLAIVSVSTFCLCLYVCFLIYFICKRFPKQEKCPCGSGKIVITKCKQCHQTEMRCEECRRFSPCDCDNREPMEITKCSCGNEEIVMMKCGECNQPARGCSKCLKRLSRVPSTSKTWISSVQGFCEHISMILLVESVTVRNR